MNDINKIRKENIEDIMELTDTQKGMLYHFIKDSDTKEYQEQTCITITGKIDIEILKKAWNHIVETNEMLRTIYKWDKLDKPVQIVLKNYDIPFKFFDLSTESNKVKDKLFEEILENHKDENINITNESIKITICKIEEYKCKMIMKNHHILYDGWSNGIILREFIEAYNCYFEGKEPIKQVKNKFKQLVKWNKQQDKNRQKDYWQKYLQDFEHGSNMFNSNNTSKVHEHIGEHTYVISDLTKNKLEACAKKLQVSVAAILYSVWSILQQRYENSEDIIFGMTVSGRTAKIKDIDNIVGMFINTIPLRVKTDSNQDVYKLIKGVEESLRAHEEFESTSLIDIKSYGKYNHEKSLFDNIVVIENYPLDKVVDKDSKIKIEDCFISETTNFNMTFAISIFDGLEIKASYNKESFEDEFIIIMTKHYENILNEILSNTSINTSKIEMISEEEKNMLLHDFNDTYADYPRNKTLYELFEEQVEKTPDNVAVIFEDKKLTYKEVNEKSNRLARTLREKGIKQDNIVAIMVERSVEMVVGMLSILKAGGAYLPIDPEYPQDRINYMLEDSKVAIILSVEKYYKKLNFCVEKINVEDHKIYSNNGENLKKVNTGKDLAYVIYTSGSTGKPKGVMIEHESIAMTLQWRKNEYKLNSEDNVLQLFSNAFDGFVTSFYTPIISGSKVVILSENDAKDVFAIKKKILIHKITHFISLPSMCLAIMESLTSKEAKDLRVITLAGESLKSNVIENCKSVNSCIEIVNEYGPTENSVVTTIMRDIDINKNITIGKPRDNTKVYIQSKYGNLQPIGVIGEICISGAALARGYLNKPELTSERFIGNPFISGERMYKTGDLARWLPDGNIEFLGRIDHQVKIRGFRIELGEIETQLLNYERVKEVVVIDREDKAGDKYLCAYMICTKEVIVSELREHLLNKLPKYMVPAYFIQLEKMPLTTNGKIDRKALPEPDGSIAAGTEYEGARNEVEEKLIKIWSEVLDVEGVGINHNFFDLGGHSLKATTLVSKIHKELNVEIPLKEIFKSPTIKRISEYIQNAEKNIYEEIKIVEEQEYYEVSSAQKRMYMLQQFDLKSTSYNMPGVLEVDGKLDIERLENAFNKLIERHQTLRTFFENIEGEIVQRVSSEIKFKVEYVDIVKTIEEAALDKEILKLNNYQHEKYIKEENEKLISNFVKVFDLSKAPLLRVGVIKVNKEKHIMMFDMHHIISDGVSMGILTKDFMELYDGKELEKVKVQYKDFSAWQNNLLKSEAMKKQEEYWLKNFSGEIPVLNMPIDFTRPSMQSFEGDSISFKLDKELTRELNKVVKETGSTMYMVLLSGINILLSKYSGQEDIVIGSTIAGRPHADLEKIIGMFVNTLAMRNHPEGSKNYKDFLKQIKGNALRAYENQEYQFEELVEKLNVRRDISRNPLFDVMFTMQNMDSIKMELKDLKLKEYKNSNKVAKFDLTFTAFETLQEISMDIDYCTGLFKKETVERMAEHFRNILKLIVKDANVKISELDMLSESEKNKLLYEFNDTYADYPKDKTIHQIFEEQAERTPNNIAVVFENKQLTYRELNEKSNKLARTLREKGVKQDSIVGILVDRSLEMIVGIMGTLKAGGAYLPIDSEYPEDRVKYTLEDSKTNIILTQGKLINKVAFKGVIIDLEDEAAYDQNIKNLDYINEQKDLAYIIYTSGTTGKPKGTMIDHKNVVRLMFNNRMQFDFNEKDVWTMFHSYCFDFSVWEMYGALLYGGKLVLISKNKARNTSEYLNILKEEKVTVLNQIPTPFYNLMNKESECSNSELKLRYVIFGGEALKPEMLRNFMKKYPESKIINMYGITETTVHVTYKEIREEDLNLKISNIGKPIATLSTYIMDKNLRLQPIGVPGELCVGGDGVSRGYLNRKELTKAKFVTNPYKIEEKIYRSGDLARMLSNGEMEYLGRIDHQVKIRGFRIELGEIENQLLNYEAIKESIVLDREGKDGDKYLCAYVVCGRSVTIGKLREHLSKNLPDYMVPSYFIQLEKMPLTSNGKIDRKALPEPDGNMATGIEYEGPRNEVEKTLVEIWSEVLAVDNIGINHNFFDLGGHSLKATTLVSKIHKKLNAHVPLKEIFKSPTVKGISEYIQNTERNIYKEIKIVEEKEYYEASSAQKRMYMLQQFDLKSTVYNMPGVLQVEGKLDVQRLEIAFNKLIKRHETLRTSFKNIEGEIIQKVSSDINFKVAYIDIRKIIEKVALDKEVLTLDNNHDEKGINEEIKELINNFISTFDLSKAPLLRVGVISVQKTKHIIIFDMHHIISDGVSMAILTKEFIDFYDGKDLEEVKVQYKDFSAWQNNFLKSEKMKKQEEYWLQNFSGEIPVLNMPMDFTRPSMQSFEGDSINLKLDKELTSDLNKIAKETGSTMYMVLLSGVNILLSKYSGQEDIVIGSAIAGRPHADLLKIIGVFVNTLAMRNYPQENKNYKDFLKEVKENSLRAYENQEYQFEELVEKLNMRRDMGRNPLFDVMFTMQNMDSTEIELKDLKFVPYKNNDKIAKFDLTFTVVELGEELLVDINYCTKLFKKEAVERIAQHFKNVLEAVVKNTSVKLSEIGMMSEDEENKLLYEFNDTYSDYPRDKTIHELFEEQVEKTPDSIAVVFEDKELTYRELNEKSNRLARTLRDKGVKQDTIVGMMVERSPQMMVGIMGILKAGGAYLPIDPEYPEDRINYMLEDSSTKILLTQSSFLDRVEANVTVLDIRDENVYAKNGCNLESVNTSKDLAYVIYTSGSTGNPKGTEITHYNVSRVVKNTNYVSITKEDIILQLSNYAFDGSVFDIYGALLNGAKLLLIEKETVLNTKKLNTLITNEKVSVFFVTTALFNILVDNEIECFNNIRKVMFGGERISISHAKKALEYMGKDKIIHVYGPTESTVFTTYYFINEINENTGNIPIGSPISNTKTYIIGKGDKLSPIGIPGELCIAGEGLARGYLNKPELDAEKFTQNPLIPGERMYKTGDLARWLPDGNIDFIGRIDHQVKMRGFRIELGEIENQLLNYEAIKESIVIDREDKEGDKYLCAYVVCSAEVTIGKLREYLLKNLPEYMVPSYFIQLEKMPLTSNGKVDRKSLPEPNGSIVAQAEYEGARNEVEEKLIDIWSEVLAVEKIGINHSFFDLGGHSLKATTLVSKMHKELNVEVPLKEIFKTPTIKGISEYIQNVEVSIYSSIEKAEENEYYEVSSAQKRMYMLQQFDIESTVYNMPGAMIVEGKLDVQRLEIAFNKLVKRHETLRTSFETIDGEIKQIISKDIEFKVEYRSKDSKHIDNIVEEFIRPFDLSKATLLRVGLIKLKEDKHLLMYDMHHIISDGVSVGILINEFTKLYEGKYLDKLRMQYKDFSQWQNKLLKSEKMKKQEEYWISRFSDEIPVLNIQTDYKRPSVQNFEGDGLIFKLERELTGDLKRIARETGSTMYMVLLSGVNILLSKYSGQEDIVIGSPIAGRPHVDLEKIIGVFVNTLAIRNYPRGSRSYEEFLKEVRENSLKAYENQEYQFEELVDKLSLRRDISRNPLFDVMFSMQNIDKSDINIDNLVFKGYEQEHKIAKFDLTFSAKEMGEEILINLQYCSKLFKKETVEKMIGHLKNIFKAVANDIKINISEIEILLEGEKHKLIYEFNDTYLENRGHKTIHQLFEEQVRKTPNNIAVVFEDKRLTYKQLNEKSNRLARTLRKKGVKSDTIIAMIVERSLEMIVGIMAVIKAGGAYLPIDEDYPEERKKYILEDSKAKILLTQEHLLEESIFIGNLCGAQVLNLEAEELYEEESYNLENISTANDLAYVIYTSGSTGKPKGVMVEHRNVVNLIFGLSKEVYSQFDHLVNVSMVSPYYFDASVKQIFPAITLGHTLFIVPRDIIFDGEKLHEFYTENSIEIADGTPVHMSMICSETCEKETPLEVKYFLVGGDMLTGKLVNEFFNRFNKYNSKIINVYGPTECCDVTTTYIVDSNHINDLSIPIGKPLPNTNVYILDKHLKLCPMGVPGELYISGAGVTRGYLNNKKLTAEKFIENPFIKGQRMYNTGDLARWLKDGNIECLGRVDNQVKIRGFRIELGEIENILLTNDYVKEAVVINKEDNVGVSYICAYVRCEKELTVGELRGYLSQYLPDYMIPAYFIPLEKMPLTPNGKLDKKVLLQHRENMACDVEYEKPRNKTEEELIKIWQEVLGVKELGINNNFFEMGGHSLKAVNVVGKIHKELDVKVPLREIFKLPTIKEISNYITETEKSKYKLIPKISEQEYYPLSRTQKRLFIVNQLNKQDVSYNMPMILTVEGILDIVKLENSIKKFIDRHEVFRTSFKFINGEPVQIINNNYAFEINVVEVKNSDVQDIVKKLIMPFDLSKAPLLRVNYVKTETGVQILMMDIHHIISDGVSNQIIVKEIVDLYKGNAVKDLDIQYKDFSVWQNEYLNSEYMKKLEHYWVEKFKDFSYTSLDRRYETSTEEIQGLNIPISFNKEQYLRIDSFCKKNSVTKFSYFMSILNIILMNEINKTDITVGIPVAGRNHEQLQNLIGVFLNVLPIRSIIDKNDTFKEYLGMVNETLIEALNNQDYPYEELYDIVTEKYGVEDQSLFSIMLNYMPYEGSEKQKENIKLEDVNFQAYKNNQIVPKYDVTFYAKEHKDHILINMVYKKSLFKEYIMERIAESFTYISDVVLNNECIFIGDIDYGEIIFEEVDDNMDDYFENEDFL